MRAGQVTPTPDWRQQPDGSVIRDPFDRRSNERKMARVRRRDELLRAINMAEEAGDLALVRRLVAELRGREADR